MNEKTNSGWLIASDVDGTLINTKYVLPPVNLAAIDAWTQKGGLFTLATGRSIESARRYQKMAHINCPAIILGGAAIYDYTCDEILYNRTLPGGAYSLVREFMDAFPDIGVEIHIGNRLYLIRESEQALEHCRHEYLPYIKTAELPDLADRPWHKVLFADSPDKLAPLRAYAKTKTIKDMYTIDTAPVYFEIMARGADKGTALLELARMKGISHEQTCAIGDYYNDVEMIAAAGFSAYTANAPAELRPDADYISKHCDQGAVADFIEHIEKGLLK